MGVLRLPLVSFPNSGDLRLEEREDDMMHPNLFFLLEQLVAIKLWGMQQ